MFDLQIVQPPIPFKECQNVFDIQFVKGQALSSHDEILQVFTDFRQPTHRLRNFVLENGGRSRRNLDFEVADVHTV